MAEFIDTLVGVYHFLADRTPRDVPEVEPRPRAVNRFQRDGRALVGKVAAGEDLRAALTAGITLLGGLDRAIKTGDRVLVKPNFNSPDPFPGSTDLAFLGAVLELLLEAGARVTVGESSGGVWRPTDKVLHKLGVFELARRLGVEVVVFEDRPDDWVRVKVNGDYLGAVTVPRLAYEADRLVYLPCMKTHSQARFTGAIKLSVGLMHPGERRRLHRGNLEQKVAEINLCLQPDLIVMDGRKAFVSGGPDKGEVVEPGVLLLSADLVAVDVEAMTVLLGYGAQNRLPSDPWQSAQVATALKWALGAGKGEYLVVG